MFKLLFVLFVFNQYGYSEFDSRLVTWYLSPHCTQRVQIEKELLSHNFPVRFVKLLQEKVKTEKGESTP
jgi:hypothetical protein